MRIELHQISKKFKDLTILSDVSIEVEEGKLLALLGPSGSGKTTLLKMIAGLEVPDKGYIYINQKNVTKHSPKDRNVGFVFQHYALFKHMNIFENVAFGMRVVEKSRRFSEAKIVEKVRKLLELVQIGHLENYYPNELSGGQRQRAALARALAVEPRVLLLDEPFSALDRKLKQDLRRWLKELQKNTNITIILVTHDQEEALDIADKIIVLNKGKIEQIGTAEEIYHSPKNQFIYNFLGNYNVFRAVKDENGKISIISLSQSRDKKLAWYNKSKIISSFASIFQNNQHSNKELNKIDEYFEVFVRPHDIELSRKALNEDFFKVSISYINLAGPFVKIELTSPDYELIHAEMAQELYQTNKFKIGEIIYAKARQITLFS